MNILLENTVHTLMVLPVKCNFRLLVLLLTDDLILHACVQFAVSRSLKCTIFTFNCMIFCHYNFILLYFTSSTLRIV